MPRAEDFMDEVVTEYRGRLVLMGDGSDRRAVEDGRALEGYRAGTMDGMRIEKLLSMLRAGRSRGGPLGLAVALAAIG